MSPQVAAFLRKLAPEPRKQLRAALRNLAAHKVRLLLTVLSVVLGTAFVTGSFVFTDTLQRTFDDLFADAAKGVDVRVSSEESGSSGVPLGDIATVQSPGGVRELEIQQIRFEDPQEEAAPSEG